MWTLSSQLQIGFDAKVVQRTRPRQKRLVGPFKRLRVQWPSIINRHKSSAEKKAELSQNTEGTCYWRRKSAAEEWQHTHMSLADRIQRLASKVETQVASSFPSYIPISHKRSGHRGWRTRKLAGVTTAIRNISISALRTAVEKEQRFRNLDKSDTRTFHSSYRSNLLALNRTTLHHLSFSITQRMLPERRGAEVVYATSFLVCPFPVWV